MNNKDIKDTVFNDQPNDIRIAVSNYLVVCDLTVDDVLRCDITIDSVGFCDINVDDVTICDISIDNVETKEVQVFSHLSLNGSNQFVLAGDNNTIEGMSEYTFEITFNLPADQKGNPTYNTSFRTLLAKGTHSNQDYGIYARYKESEDTNIRHIIFILNGEAVRVQSASLPVDQVNKLAIVGDSSNITMYNNGSQFDTFLQGVTSIRTSTDPLRIGWDGGSDRYFPGFIDEIRIWNIKRTEQEINDNMDTKLNGDEAGLVAYYKADNNGGDTLLDSSPNNNNGTLQNNSNDNMWIEGDL